MSEDFEDDDLIEEEEIDDTLPDKYKQSQAWRDIEAKREERRLQKQLEKEFDLDGLDEWDD